MPRYKDNRRRPSASAHSSATARPSAPARTTGQSQRSGRTTDGSRTALQQQSRRLRVLFIPLATLAIVLLVWELLCRTQLVPAYLLPAPSQVVYALLRDMPLIASHTATSLTEALLGLVLGVIFGFIAAWAMDRFEAVYLALSPLMTLSQTIPTIAIAPLLVLWFGYGLLPKIVLVILTTFFPIAISLVAGFRSLDPDYIDLLTTMGASRRQIFLHAKLPASGGQFFSGLRISATYAIVAAVIAEWLGGFSGLGVYMTRVRKSFAYDRMFASILVISAVSLALLVLVRVLERICLPWRRSERENS